MAIPIKAVLQVSTRNFTKGLNIARKGVVALAGAVTRLTVLVTALTTVFGFFALRQAQLIDRLGKVSKTTDFSTAALQKFRFAAEQSGVSSDQADVALRRFSRRFGEAARGAGELLPALRRLGIDVRDSEGNLKTAEKVLFEFADGIAATKNESAQLALAFKAFDSEGAELVETLKNGSQGLRDFFETAEQFNLILSQTAIQNTEIFNDSLGILKMQVTALAQAFVAQLTPALTTLVRTLIVKLNKAVEETDGGLQGVAETIKQKVITAVLDLTKFLMGLYNKFVFVFNNIMSSLSFLEGFELENLKKNLGDFQELLGQPLLSRLTTLSITTGRTGELIKEEFGGAFILTEKNIKRAIELIEADIKRLKDSGVPDLTLLPFTEEDFKKLDILRTVLGGMEQGPQTPIIPEREIEEVIVKAQQLDTILSRIFGKERTAEFWNDWYREGVGSLTKFGAIAKLILGEQIFENLREGLEAAGVGDFVKTMSDGLVKGAQMFEDALANAVVNGKADFSDLAAHLKQVLAKAMIQKFFTGPIMALMGLAGGGPAKAGQPYIVGEEGPELFIPGASGTVIPNHQLQSGGGVSGGQVNYTINAVDAPSFQALVARDPEFIFSVTEAGRRRIPGRS